MAREAHLSCEVDSGETGVVLQRSQNLNIDGIESTNRDFVL